MPKKYKNVFVSGKIGSENEPAEVIALLEAKGYNITFNWTEAPHLRPYEANKEKSLDLAIKEIDGVKDADILILMLHDKGVGMFVEFGAALAKGIPVIAIDNAIEPRSMFLYHPLVMRVSSVERALRALENWDYE